MVLNNPYLHYMRSYWISVNLFGMQINEEKSTLYHYGLDEYEIITLHNIFSFSVVKLENGMKYLGFHLKPCRYLLKD